MSYTQLLIDHLSTQLTEEEHKKITPLILGFAKARAVKREEDAKHQSATDITFGKYKNKSIQEVFEIDPDYVQWLTRSDLGKKNPRLLATALSLTYG